MIDQNFIGRIVLIIGAHCGCSQLKPGMDAQYGSQLCTQKMGWLCWSPTQTQHSQVYRFQNTHPCATQSIDDRNKLCACATRSSIGKEPLIQLVIVYIDGWVCICVCIYMYMYNQQNAQGNDHFLCVLLLGDRETQTIKL